MLITPPRQTVRMDSSPPPRLSPAMSRREDGSVSGMASIPGLQQRNEASGKIEWLDKDKGMVAWPGMGRNSPGVQQMWPKTYPLW